MNTINRTLKALCMWKEFESSLEKEIHSLLHEYRHVRMSEYKRNDIKSYLQYISLHRSGFKRILLEENMPDIVSKDTTEYPEPEKNVLLAIVDALLTKELDFFAPEYSHFPLLLHFHTRIPSDSLQALCLKYWKARYPSIKKSFILPLCSKLPSLLNPELKDLLSKKLRKGKLDPFDESVALCKALSIPPPENFIDPQLSRLREMIHESEEQPDHSTEYSGCHCD